MGGETIDLTQFDGHTPGPWTASRFGAVHAGPFRQFVNGSAQSQIAAAIPRETDDLELDTDAERDANARLMAAAPTLLQAVARARPERPGRQLSPTAKGGASGSRRIVRSLPACAACVGAVPRSPAMTRAKQAGGRRYG